MGSQFFLKMKGVQIVGILSLGAALGAVVGQVMGQGYLALSAGVILTVAATYSAPKSEVLCLVSVFLVGLCRGMQWNIVGGCDFLSSSHFIQRAYSSLCSSIDGIGLTEQSGALVKALISGDKSDISPQIKEAFRCSGASHLLALSGLHLGIIYGIISKTLSLAGGHPIVVKVRSCITIVLCGFYAIVTGASPSIIRAFLFVLLKEIARMTTRSCDPLVIFSSALAIHLVINPGSVTTVGFQLSYLATFGIYTLYPRLKAIYPSGGIFGKSGGIFGKIWELACLSISCQIFTAPVAYLHFRTFPKYFLLTNLIAMPLGSLLIAFAVAATALSALGVHPIFIAKAIDLLAKGLIYSLGIIGNM